MSIKGKKILVGLTGGIACYKVPNFVRALRKAECEVHVMMTENATKFITPLTLETLSDNPVAVNMFSDHEFTSVRHIDFAKWADLIVIAPATANLIGKSANGISDDLITTVLSATKASVLLAPAMNPNMWENKITQDNLSKLKSKLGWLTVGPDEGWMAEDQWGVGRMVEPEKLFESVNDFFSKSPKKKLLEGKKILITAGPCREPIDPVRFVSNRSSGKMGYALARAAVLHGAETTLISGLTNLPDVDGATNIQIVTTADLQKAVSKHFKSTDILFMAAAPADYKPDKIQKNKIKKGDKSLSLSLTQTDDILKSISKIKQNNQLVIGFAVETENDVSNAKKKLKEKNLDLIVLNNPTEKGAAFDHDTNLVTLLAPGKKPDRWKLMSKDEVALKLLEKVAAML